MDFGDFEEFLEYIDDTPYEYPERRYLRDAGNPLELYDNGEFKKRFRFDKRTVQEVLMPLLFPNQRATSDRGLPVPPVLQLLLALRFFATGSFQIICGDLQKLSQSTASKIISSISRELAIKVREYIKFPNHLEQNAIQTKFFNIAGFPGVRACIDCTHIPIKNPNRQNGEAFRNRKGIFSINVQLVGGPDLKIYDIVARWPGSVHDSRIFANSRCCMNFEEGVLTGILLGDSGYAQTTYMFTPIINPQTEPEQSYNRAQILTRNSVERLIGVWKRRFACLSRKLQNNLSNTTNIIVACAVLHNICVEVNDEGEEPFPNENIVPVLNITDTVRGSLIRDAFIQRHFLR